MNYIQQEARPFSLRPPLFKVVLAGAELPLEAVAAVLCQPDEPQASEWMSRSHDSFQTPNSILWIETETTEPHMTLKEPSRPPSQSNHNNVNMDTYLEISPRLCTKAD